MLRSFRAGTHGAWDEVRTARCIEFDIETQRPMPVNTDGEIVTSTPAKFLVHPGAITVLRLHRRRLMRPAGQGGGLTLRRVTALPAVSFAAGML